MSSKRFKACRFRAGYRVDSIELELICSESQRWWRKSSGIAERSAHHRNHAGEAGKRLQNPLTGGLSGHTALLRVESRQ